MASLARPLLAQARHLVAVDPTRPQQASLRRAVSAVYYSLFHFLVEESNRLLLGTTAELGGLRNVLARAYTHTEMANAARTFAGGNLPAGILQRLGPAPIPSELRAFTQTFLDLQEQRHLADYDIAATFARSDTVALIVEIEQAIDAWPTIRDEPASRLFLLGLLVWGRIRDR